MNEVRFDEYPQQAIITELRAIKATLSAIAIKMGAISNPFSITITGQDDYTSLTSEQREELKRWSEECDKEMNQPKDV